jgi:hypothetical protein
MTDGGRIMKPPHGPWVRELAVPGWVWGSSDYAACWYLLLGSRNLLEHCVRRLRDARHGLDQGEPDDRWLDWERDDPIDWDRLLIGASGGGQALIGFARSWWEGTPVRLGEATRLDDDNFSLIIDSFQIRRRGGRLAPRLLGMAAELDRAGDPDTGSDELKRQPPAHGGRIPRRSDEPLLGIEP